jgi:hypothetical protein
MITNISRLKAFMACPTMAFNRYHRHVEGPRSLNLVDGSAFHKGVALGQATKDWPSARAAAQTQFHHDYEAANMMAEEEFLRTTHAALVDRMIECYQEQYQTQDIVVLQPECEFYVEIPHTHHHDITMHSYVVEENGERREVWGMPPTDAIIQRRVVHFHHREDKDCPCFRPHALTGRTDGILSWGGHIWLQEHKTTSIKGDQFWQQWHIDMQITGYIYGVWKSTGMLPKGVILNAIYKPSESQISAWNKSRKNGPPKGIVDYVEYMREIFLRTPEDLQAFEKQLVDYCNEWEWRILNGTFPKANIPAHCFNYNRKCDYYGACLGHDRPEDFENLALREFDYVDLKRQELVQIHAN